MGGRMSRNKGGRGERQVIGILQKIVDKVCEECEYPRIVLRRNADQRFAKKQYDVIGIPWMALEVKYQENQSGLEGWWRQTLEATMDRQTPVLFYRRNHVAWSVRTRVHVNVSEGLQILATVTMDLRTFKFWFEHRLREDLS